MSGGGGVWVGRWEWWELFHLSSQKMFCKNLLAECPTEQTLTRETASPVQSAL